MIESIFYIALVVAVACIGCKLSLLLLRGITREQQNIRREWHKLCDDWRRR